MAVYNGGVRIENKKARFNYEVIASYEAGIVLTGAEVKSVRLGQVSLTGSRIMTVDNELWVVGMNIAKYVYTTDDNYDSMRRKKLLLKKEEINTIEAKRRLAGLTMVPLAVYNKGSLIKMEVGLVRGKKKYEKREIVKKRDIERGLREILKK